MQFKDAVEKSIRSFYNGELPEKAIEASEKEFPYTLEFFDDLKEQDLEEISEKESKDEKE